MMVANFKPPKPIRDETWRRFVHEHPCRKCGSVPTQAAHLGHSSMGRKPGDDQVVPLCPDCHRDFDTCPNGKEWWWMNEIAIPEAKASYREKRV